MDYSKFRSTSTEGSAVGVNHKALITRALTKYPVDFALYRELLQNSADARSSSAVIQLETNLTDISGSRLHDASIKRLRFSNDGLDFAEDDWGRLREIASGNPNETKIGAFGVGFYSVFELTDEPLVHSGNQIMSFKYHGVQLHYYFTEKAPSYQKGTLIDLPYRTEQSLPDLVKFVGFLVQSFMLVNLNEIRFELKHNDRVTKLLHLKKQVNPPQPLPLPQGFQPKSPNKTLKMSSLERRSVNVTIEYLNSTQMPPLTVSKGILSFGKQLVTSLMTTSTNPDEYTTVTCELTKADAFVDVSVSSSFRSKMIETLLKPPPKQAVMSLISFSGEKAIPSKSQLTSYIFPTDYNDAKIFIGFATKQSTGLKSHLALNQVIPTMERTAVDMSNQFVKEWNTEMLYMGGVMARCVYEFELSNFQAQGDEGVSNALFVCSRFRFGQSAPDTLIGRCVREGFWRASKETLVPSTQGILPSSKVRLPGNAQSVLRTTPIVVEKELASDLERLKYVRIVSLEEICRDIASSPLSRDSFVEVVKWMAENWSSFNSAVRSQLLTATTVQTDKEVSFNLGSIKWFHDRSLFPEEELAATLPENCLPSDLTNSAEISRLESIGLRPLSLSAWAEDRLRHFQITGPKEQESIAFALLHVCGRSWPRISSSQRRTIIGLLNSVKCVPTSQGLKSPTETYVEEISLFPKLLPVVSPVLAVARSWLIEIGVRQSMDMGFVLNALSSRKLKWANEDLVQYLYDNRKNLKPEDWLILKDGPFFKSSGSADGFSRAQDLYAPSDQLARIGLSTLQFVGWNKHSPQAAILFKLGLKQYPSPQVLFSKAAKKEAALLYFATNFEEANYSKNDIAGFEIIPTTEKGVWSKPSSCYRDSEVAIFNEKVISDRWEAFSSKLGVLPRPPVSSLLIRVLDDPAAYLNTLDKCNAVFTYFSRYTGEFAQGHIKQCRDSSFVPVFDQNSVVIAWERPRDVFLPRTGSDMGSDTFRPLLRTVHPSQSATPFLTLVGVSDKPSVSQIVARLIQNPSGVFAVLKTAEKYKAVLASIEAEWPSIARYPKLIEGMKRASFLLGVKYTESVKDKGLRGEIALYSADQLAIVDDVIVFNQFRSHIVVAPQEDDLERLYQRLGVRLLSQTLKEQIKVGVTVQDEIERSRLESRINERLELFLENTSKQVKDGGRKVTVSLVRGLQLKRDLPPYASITVSKCAFMSPHVSDNLLVVPGENFDWIDVAVALTKRFLVKPDQDSSIVLETQLSSDLRSLERKGYNVERLQNKMALGQFESKLPKIEYRDDVNSKLEPSAEKSSSHGSSSGHTGGQVPATAMPGSWPSPRVIETHRNDSQEPSRASHGSGESIPPPSQNDVVHNHSEPLNSRPNSTSRGGLFSQVRNLIPKAFGNESAQTQAVNPDVQKLLSSGLKQATPFNSSELRAPKHADAPSPIPEGTCTGSRKVYEMKLLDSLPNGVKLFTAGGSPQPAQDEMVLSETLLLLGSIFNYSGDAIHLYRDSDKSTIAFNHGGSLFFNSCIGPDSTLLVDYYYPVMAHELAHNLVASHGASHSFYTEAYIQKTVGKYAKLRANT